MTQKQHMEFIKSSIETIKQLQPFQFLEQVFSFVIVIASALSMWKTLCLGLNTNMPISVVLTHSMFPAYQRGDILFLTEYKQPYLIGDPICFQLSNRPIPMIHRIIDITETKDNDLMILTKGDHNNLDDRGLYPKGKLWLKKSDLRGKPRAYIPYVGIFTIWFNDYPLLKWVVFLSMGMGVLVSKDPQ